MNNIEQKTFNYKVYDNEDNFLATWDDVAQPPRFTQGINSGGSELQLLLARDPDALGSDVEFNNKVIVSVHDKEVPEGRNLFQGFISEYKPIFSKGNKSTRITLLGFGADLNDYLAEIYETTAANIISRIPDGGSSTFAYTHGQDDLAFRFRANYESIKKLHLYLDASQAIENFDLVEDDNGQPTGESVIPSGGVITRTETLISITPDTWDEEFLFPFGVKLEIGKYYHFVISAGSAGSAKWFYNTSNLHDDASWLFNDNSTGWVVQVGDLNFKIEPAAITTTIPYIDVDPAEMLRDILELYEFRGGKVSYDGASLEPTLTTATYTFKVMTILECINKIIELCPPNFYWYIDQATNIIYLKKTTEDYTHKLVYGKNVIINDLTAISQSIVNTVYFTGAEISAGVNFYKKYEEQDLIDRFGVKSKAISDNRVTLEATADKIVSRILTENSSPKMRSNIQLVDSNVSDTPAGYDIENIRVGEVISLANIGQNGSSRWGKARWGIDRWGMSFRDFGTIILQIGRLMYSPDKIVIEAKELPVNFYKQLAGQGGSIEKIETVNNPDSPS